MRLPSFPSFHLPSSFCLGIAWIKSYRGRDSHYLCCRTTALQPLSSALPSLSPAQHSQHQVLTLLESSYNNLAEETKSIDLQENLALYGKAIKAQSFVFEYPGTWKSSDFKQEEQKSKSPFEGPSLFSAHNDLTDKIQQSLDQTDKAN